MMQGKGVIRKRMQLIFCCYSFLRLTSASLSTSRSGNRRALSGVEALVAHYKEKDLSLAKELFVALFS